MKKVIFSLLLIGIIAISGCTEEQMIDAFYASIENKPAKKVVDDFYLNVENKDYDSILTLIGEERITPELENETLTLLTAINNKLGDYEDHQIITWNERTMVGTEGSGTSFFITSNVSYAKYPATETFTIYNPSGTDRFLITNYHSTSKGFILE